MKRKNAKNEYKWNFKHLYDNHDKWMKDLQKIEKLILDLKKLKGKLNIKNNFVKFLKMDKEIDIIVSKLNQYIHYSDIDTTDISYQKLSGIFSTKITSLLPEVSFISNEIKEIGEKTIFSWINADKKLEEYRYPYKVFFRNSKYILDKSSEKLLSMVIQSRDNSSSIYDLLAYADRKIVKINYENKEQELTTTLYKEIIENSNPLKDQQLRIDASKKISLNIIENKHSFAKIYEGIIIKNFEDVKIYNYDSCLQKSLNSDNVDVNIYKNLIKIGKKYSNLFVDYCNIIKHHYKFKKFYSTDRNLKLIKSIDKKYSVEDAKKIIKEALKPLGEEYLSFLDIAWSKNRIDYFEDTNKRDGAYSSGGTGVEPIILMNWDDTINSVNTLAHEVGHSVHTLFSDKYQPFAIANYPIILAEVASTINEHLLFDYLYKNTNDKKEKIFLLQNRILDIMNTFFRQIHFADFELQVHEMVEKGIPLNSENLVNLFDKISNEFGYNVFDINEDNKSYSWPRISHFFHSPFYVYKYATCIVASFKLFNDVKNGNSKNLLNFLKSGGKKDPLDILKDFGIDYSKEDNYLELINVLKSMILDLKKLL